MRITTGSFFLLLVCAACGGAQPEPEAPSGGPVGHTQLTAETCQASGGTVVGDIGDGAIHRPDYKCPSGKPPSGTISAAPGGPVAVEGSVCCPK